MDTYKRWELWLKILTLGAVLVAGIWAVYSYRDAKQQEFYSKFWNTKLSLFLETSSSASQMATARTMKEYNEAYAIYWELFYGRLSLVEGTCVKAAMVKFSGHVPEKSAVTESDLPIERMKQPSYQLTRALQKELILAWRDPFSELDYEKIKCD